jgi:hypothetical protein
MPKPRPASCDHFVARLVVNNPTRIGIRDPLLDSGDHVALVAEAVELFRGHEHRSGFSILSDDRRPASRAEISYDLRSMPFKLAEPDAACSVRFAVACSMRAARPRGPRSIWS